MTHHFPEGPWFQPDNTYVGFCRCGAKFEGRCGGEAELAWAEHFRDALAATPIADNVACSKCGNPNMMMCDCSLPSATAPIANADWVMVPREPTEAMILAAVRATNGWRFGDGVSINDSIRAALSAMLSASPAHVAVPDDVRELVFKLRASADIQSDAATRHIGRKATTDRAELMRKAANRLEALALANASAAPAAPVAGGDASSKSKEQGK